MFIHGLFLLLLLPSLLTAQLTGTWYVTPYHTASARYYITQTSPTTITWLGDSNTGAWRNLATGTISGNTITVNWRDPPPATNSGTVYLTIQADGTLKVASGSTGFDVGATFIKQTLAVDRQISGVFTVQPYHTSTALYYITQDSDNTLRWFGDSGNGQWRNTGTGVITKNSVEVTWVDIGSTNKGVVQLRLNDDGTLTTVAGTGFDIGSVFAQPGRIVSGVYSVTPYHTPQARYYISVSGNSITWLGDSNTGAWRNIGSGTLSNGIATVTWQDPPPASNSGSVVLKVNPDRSLTVTSGSGFDINSQFTLQPVSEDIGITGTFEVVPYHTASARYYITQTSPTTVVWLGLSNNDGWRNTGTGTLLYNKNILKVTWTDIPPSTNKGETTFLIKNRNLIVIKGTGFDLNSIFSFSHPTFDYEFPSLSGIYQVAPYHTASARYYISQTSPNSIVWLGDSKVTGGWRNTASGTITGTSISVQWQDPPPGTNSGEVTLKISKKGCLSVVDGSGFDLGSIFSKTYTSDRRITGTYTVLPYHTSTALYYITQTSSNQIVWYGNSNNGGWRNTASGTITGNTITVDWVDFPPSTNQGQVVLTINPDSTLTVVSGTGFDIGAVFAQIDQVVSGVYSVSPYHTPSALYYVTKAGDNLVWYGDSNNGGFRNVGTGFHTNGLAFVDWKDFAPSSNQGSVVFKINDRSLTTLSGSGFDISSKFLLKPLSAAATVSAVTGPYQSTSATTSPAPTHYVTQTSDNALVWLTLSGSTPTVGKGAKVNNQWEVTWSCTTSFASNSDRTLTVSSSSGVSFPLSSQLSFSASGYFSTVTNAVLASTKEEHTNDANIATNVVVLPYWALGLIIAGCVVLVATVIALVVVLLKKETTDTPYHDFK